MNVITDRRREVVLKSLKMEDADTVVCVGPNTGFLYVDTGKTYTNLHVKLDDVIAMARAELLARREKIKSLRVEIKEYRANIAEKSKLPEEERGPAWDLYMHDMNVRLRELNEELDAMQETDDEEELVDA